MTSEKFRSKEKQRLRKHVAEVLDPLPPRYVLEVMAQRFGLTNGSFEVRVRNGFVQFATATHVLSAEETEFPNRWTDKDKEQFFADYTKVMRELDEMMGRNSSEEELRSTLRTDEFSAAQLLEREPKPTPEGRRPATLKRDRR